MGLRSWLKVRLGLAATPGTPSGTSINLVSGDADPLQFAAPASAGIDLTLVQKPWSVSRLESIFRSAQRLPSPASLQAARQARHCLSSFWLVAPVDQLEQLYTGEIGALQRQQLEGPLVQQPLAADEAQWRDALAERLQDPAQASQQLNLLLAVMPYFPPYRLKLDQALDSLPRWLLKDYVVYCEPELKAQLEGPAGLLQASAPQAAPATDLLPLTERRGEEAMEWFRNEEAINRMQALVNLYAMDPQDAETKAELGILRRVAAQLWLDVDASQIETLYQTPVGLLSRSLITCGFAGEVLGEQDQQVRQHLAARVGNLSSADALNALMAALLFYAPGQVQVADSSTVPAWLLDELRSF